VTVGHGGQSEPVRGLLYARRRSPRRSVATPESKRASYCDDAGLYGIGWSKYGRGNACYEGVLNTRRKCDASSRDVTLPAGSICCKSITRRRLDGQRPIMPVMYNSARGGRRGAWAGRAANARAQPAIRVSRWCAPGGLPSWCATGACPRGCVPLAACPPVRFAGTNTGGRAARGTRA